MALSYAQVNSLIGNQTYTVQMAEAINKLAQSKIAAATGAELALCSAILKNSLAYAPRFIQAVLVANAGTLTSDTNGTTLIPVPTDASIDSVANTAWGAQALAGA